MRAERRTAYCRAFVVPTSIAAASRLCAAHRYLRAPTLVAIREPSSCACGSAACDHARFPLCERKTDDCASFRSAATERSPTALRAHVGCLTVPQVVLLCPRGQCKDDKPTSKRPPGRDSNVIGPVCDFLDGSAPTANRLHLRCRGAMSLTSTATPPQAPARTSQTTPGLRSAAIPTTTPAILWHAFAGARSASLM